MEDEKSRGMEQEMAKKRMDIIQGEKDRENRLRRVVFLSMQNLAKSPDSSKEDISKAEIDEVEGLLSNMKNEVVSYEETDHSLKVPISYTNIEKG
jgi:hypothetical protein